MAERRRQRKTHQSLRLWRSRKHIYLLPLTDNEEHLCISRSGDRSLSVRSGAPEGFEPSDPPKTVFGLLGIIDLLSGPFLVVITAAEQVGLLRHHPVFQIRAVEIVQCNSDVSRLSKQQLSDERQYLRILRKGFNERGLYFSYEVDITMNFQNYQISLPEKKDLPLWKQADSRFLWNKFLLQPLTDVARADKFMLPVIQGSYQVLPMTVNRTVIDIILVARRSVARIGTRLWTRGADEAGNCANYVETEQILQFTDNIASFVQVRGSIPLLWEQIVNLKYKPKMTITDASSDALERHFRDLRKTYGSVLAIDLINQKGSESRLGRLYRAAMDSLSSNFIDYAAFDFHKECSHGNFTNIKKLVDQQSLRIQTFGYFLRHGSMMVREQRGVVRTNCIDCLDRTNVTQSAIALWVMENQFSQLGISDRPDFATHTHLHKMFKYVWANHGDDISRQYTGTNALKGDFVRTGKRGPRGMFNDGVNSVKRYYLNNFCDGERQDALNLVTGKFEIEKGQKSPFKPYADLGLKVVVGVFGLYIFAVVWAFFSFCRAIFGGGTAALVTAVQWGAVAGAIYFALGKFGKLFTSRPKLIEKKWP